jgi:alpha-L-fucosidase 2
VTGLPSGANASFYDFKVFGTVDGPTFYKDTNYGGTSVTLGSHTYTLAQMQAEGIADNSISSIRVPAGFTVVAYVGSAFDGTSWTFTSTIPVWSTPATTI